MDLARRMHQADRGLREGGLQSAARATAERFGIESTARELIGLYRELMQRAGADRAGL